ncbi:hypothetical protein D3C78_1635630 [compost metagenome]
MPADGLIGGPHQGLVLFQPLHLLLQLGDGVRIVAGNPPGADRRSLALVMLRLVLQLERLPVRVVDSVPIVPVALLAVVAD